MQLPCTHCSRAQHGSSLEHELPEDWQLEHVPAMQVPAQQSSFVVHVAEGPPQALHLPFTQAKPSQHSLVLLQLRSIPRQVKTHTPSGAHIAPEQQKGPGPDLTQAPSCVAHVARHVPGPLAFKLHPRPSQQLPLVSQAPPASMHRGGPQTPPMQAPPQHAAPFGVHGLLFARHPSEHRPFWSQAKSSQQSVSLPHVDPKSRQEHAPPEHDPEQQSEPCEQFVPLGAQSCDGVPPPDEPARCPHAARTHMPTPTT